MDNNLSMFLVGKLDIHKSITKINKDLPKLHGQLKHIKLKASIDTKAFNNINAQIKQMQKGISLDVNLKVPDSKTGQNIARQLQVEVDKNPMTPKFNFKESQQAVTEFAKLYGLKVNEMQSLFTQALKGSEKEQEVAMGRIFNELPKKAVDSSIAQFSRLNTTAKDELNKIREYFKGLEIKIPKEVKGDHSLEGYRKELSGIVKFSKDATIGLDQVMQEFTKITGIRFDDKAYDNIANSVQALTGRVRELREEKNRVSESKAGISEVESLKHAESEVTQLFNKLTQLEYQKQENAKQSSNVVIQENKKQAQSYRNLGEVSKTQDVFVDGNHVQQVEIYNQRLNEQLRIVEQIKRTTSMETGSVTEVSSTDRARVQKEIYKDLTSLSKERLDLEFKMSQANDVNAGKYKEVLNLVQQQLSKRMEILQTNELFDKNLDTQLDREIRTIELKNQQSQMSEQATLKYSELTALQKQSFDLEKQSIGATGVKSKKLDAQKSKVQEQMGVLNKTIQDEGLVNKIKDEQIAKQNELNRSKLEMLKIAEKEKNERIAFNNMHNQALKENKAFDKQTEQKERALQYEQKVRYSMSKQQKADQDKLLREWLKAKDTRTKTIHTEAMEMNKRYDAEIQRIKQLKQERKKALSAQISQNVKGTMERMTSTPDGVKQLNQQFKEQERVLGTVNQAQKKLNQSQQEYWASVRKEKMTDMTSKSKEQQDLSKYYQVHGQEMNKFYDEAIKQNKAYDVANKGLIGTFSQLKGSQTDATQIAQVLSQQYGNLEVRGKQLDEITGKYTVTLRKNARENLILKGTHDQVTGALRVQNKTVQQSRNIQLGFFEQLKIALARVPKLNGDYKPSLINWESLSI